MYSGLFVGRFHAQKGLSDLVAVWRDVLAVMPSATLGVIGDGFGLAAVEFRRMLADLPGGGVKLLGVLTGKDKYAAMQQSEVFIFPSHYESWGHVALEAMAMGRPVVGYDIPSSREAFGSAMVLIPPYDTHAMASAVVKLLTDKEQFHNYRTRSLSLASRFDWDDIAREFANRLLN